VKQLVLNCIVTGTMDSQKRIIITRQPRTASIPTRDYKDNDDFSDEYQDNASETDQNVVS
jgi:hypothetical protein